MRPFPDARGVVDRAQVEPAVEKLEARLARGRSGWLVHEQLGRLRRIVGDLAQAQLHLHEALRSRPNPDDQAWAWLQVAAVHRLLGADDAVASSAARAAELAEDSDDVPGLGTLLEARFLLGDDAEVLTAHDRRGPQEDRADTVAAMAVARAGHDAGAMEAAVDAWVAHIRRAGEKISSAGGLLLHDWYEIAQEVTAQLRG